MTFDFAVGLTILGILLLGSLFRKPMQHILIRKIAKAYLPIHRAKHATAHEYTKHSLIVSEQVTKDFYSERQAALARAGYSHVGDSENLSLRAVLPKGGYFQKHFIDSHQEISLTLFHISSKGKQQTALVHGMRACSAFNTGTIITSISMEDDKALLPSDIPSQLIFNAQPFCSSVDDFLNQHQRDLSLYLDNREGATITPLHTIDDCLALANKKQGLIHHHNNSDELVSDAQLSHDIDPRFWEYLPEIKREVIRQLAETQA